MMKAQVFPARNNAFVAIKTDHAANMWWSLNSSLRSRDGSPLFYQSDKKKEWFKVSKSLNPIAKREMVKAGFEISGDEFLDKQLTAASFFDVTDRDDLRDDQYNVVLQLMDCTASLVNCVVGWGKSHVLVYLAKHFNNRKNLLICVNSNSVAEELRLKCESKGVDMTNIKILNPIAYCASNESSDPESLRWFENVDVVLCDEMDSLTESMEKVLGYCKNKSVLFGYSANCDRFQGKNLSDESCLNKIDPEVCKIIEYFGFAITSGDKPAVDLYVIPARMKKEYIPKWVEDLKYSDDNDKKEQYGYMKAMYSIKAAFEGPAILKVLEEYVMPNVQNMLYIPFRYIKHGEMLYRELALRHLDKVVVLWDGKNGIRRSDNVKVVQTAPKRKGKKVTYTLEDLKRWCNEDNDIDILIASAVSYEGVNLINISDAFIIFASLHGGITQTAGRAVRYATPVIWTMEPTNPNDCPVYVNSHKKRLSAWNKSFKVTKKEFGKE